MDIKYVLVALTAISAVFGATADCSPAMLSLLTPAQLPGAGCDVCGARLSLIYGDCSDVKGLDIGVAGHCDGDFSGLAIGGANIVDERLYGVQIGLVNWNGGVSGGRHSVGLQAGIANYSKVFGGVQYGLANWSAVDFTGLQSGLLNSAQDIYGAQLGGYFVFGANVCVGTMCGCQIGLLNWAGRAEGGIQIGLVNIVCENGWLPVLPVVNGGF